MSNNANNVAVGKPKVGGAVFVAPIGTSLPTDATSSIAAAFNDLGYISDSGVVNSNTMETQSFKAWGGDPVYDALTGKTDTYKMTFIEATNLDVLKVVYGSDNVTGTLESGITIKANSKDQASQSFCIDTVLRDGTLKRIVIPNGKVTAVGDITYNDSTLVGYETTISAYPDSQGNTHYDYVKKPNTSM